MTELTTTYPEIAGVTPTLLREIPEFPGGNHETFVSRGCYDFTELYEVAVTIIPQYDPDNLSAPSGWSVEIADEFTGIPAASTTLGQTFETPDEAARYVTEALDRLVEKI